MAKKLPSFIFLFFLILNQINGQSIDGSCEECINFIQVSSQLFASPEVIEETEKFLKNTVCQQSFHDDLEGCKKGIEKWYKPMLESGIQSEDFGSRFCYHYGICRPFHEKTPFNKIDDECIRCLDAYGYLAILLSNQFGIGETITYLSGPVFCNQPTFIENNQSEACQDYLQAFLPYSLPMSARQIEKYAPDLCKSLFEICL